MKNGNSIPDIAHVHICLNQLKCNNMIKNYQKNQQYLYIVNQVRIGYLLSCSFFHLTHLVINL